MTDAEAFEAMDEALLDTYSAHHQDRLQVGAVPARAGFEVLAGRSAVHRLSAR